MRKYSTLISIITLIFGFSFYGEYLSINIHDTYYLIAAEVVCFTLWAMIMLIFLFFNLKNYFRRNEL